MASNLKAMASNLLSMAFNLEAMADLTIPTGIQILHLGNLLNSCQPQEESKCWNLRKFTASAHSHGE